MAAAALASTLVIACALDFDRYDASHADESARAEAGTGTNDADVLDGSTPPPPGDSAADVGALDGGSLSDGLTAFYRFDETNGTSATDSSGNGRTATLAGGASFGGGVQNNAAALNGNGEHVSLPGEAVRGLTSFSFSVWINLNASSMWSRVFNFGTGTNVYMFLTPRSGDNTLRFSITTAGNSSAAEQRLNGPLLAAGTWRHVAVTLAGTMGTLYVDGAPVDTKTISLNPSSLGTTSQNWLGRSPFVDPSLSARLDNVRIYNRALSAGEVQSLFQQRE